MSKIKFDEHQQKAFDACLSNEFQSIFITGDGGTGKSEIIKQTIKHFKKKKVRVIILAPTNSASKNIGGETLHSHFGLNALENIKANKETEFIIFDNFNDVSDPIDANDTVMIVDEISMVGRNILKKTIDTVSPTKLILLGDLGQLPPPKDKTVDWTKYTDKTFKLFTNYRATNPKINKIVQDFKISGKLPRDIKAFKKSDFNQFTKVIAFTNAELSRLQHKILGYDNGRIGDKCILSGSILQMGETMFDNGDEVQLIKPTKIRVDISSYKGLKAYEIRPKSIVKYPLKVILGDYKDYSRLKSDLYKEFKSVILQLITKYSAYDEREIWKMYKADKLDENESDDLKEVYRDYISIKFTPYARHNQFITTYKAQGKGYKNVALALYDMPSNEHKYVAVSRAIDDIKVINRRTI